jgi:acetoin utilization protein AcuC
MSKDKRVGLYIGDELGRYGFPNGHPFGPARMAAFWRRAQERGLDGRAQVLAPTATERDHLVLFHDADYVDFVREQSVKPTRFLDAGDTPAFEGCFEAASAVVGSALDATRRIIAGELDHAFVPIAGLHHASRKSAAGFCVFNDCGVVIESLRHEHGIRRVAYVDIDAHHGDGVFYAFEDDAEVCFADVHQDGRTLYPGTGAADETGRGEAAGTKLNLPLPPGATDEDFHAVWPRVEAHLRAARPDFILLQCGADSVDGDPITNMRFSPAAHAHAARRLAAIADELGHGRVLALGGGGYNHENLAAAWTGVVDSLLVPADD